VKYKFLETIKILDGRIYHLPYHQLRVDNVFRAYKRDNTQQLKELLENVPSQGLFRCRVVYDVDGDFQYEYIPYKKRLINRLKIVYNNDLVYDKKYNDRKEIEDLLKQKGECDDILIVQNGLCTDTSIANVAFYDGKRWLTPKKPLLEGTTRARLLQEGFLHEADIELSSVKSFQKMALMNAMIDFDIIAQDNLEDIMC